MEYIPSYQINIEKREIVVRFQRHMIDEETLGRFLDYLEFESIRKRSQLTEKQAAELAKEIDVAVWKKLKPIFIGK
jgi:hypothetical protein